MQPIAERALTLKQPDGAEYEITVRIWAPKQTGPNEWTSDVEFAGPLEQTKRFTGSGMDAFQALTFALAKIPMLLERFEAMGEIAFCGGPGHMFPPILFQSTPE